MSRGLKNYFYAGMIVIMPIFLTVFILNWILNFVLMLTSKSFTVKMISTLIENFGIERTTELKYFIYFFYVIGVFVFIIIVGYITRNIVGKKITYLINNMMSRLPVVKHIYLTISQIVNLLSSTNNQSYKKAVLIEYPRKGVYSIGFLTADNNKVVEKISGEEMCNIFVPTSPNPTSGMFVMLSKKEVKVLDMKIEDAIKLVISGGVLTPGMEKKNDEKD